MTSFPEYRAENKEVDILIGLASSPILRQAQDMVSEIEP
jgi:hypothetical protein